MTVKESTDAIFDAVFAETGVGYWDIIDSTRKREVVRARIIAAYLIYKYTKLSDNQVAEIIKRDRTTILYYRDMIANVLETPAFNKDLHYLYHAVDTKLKIDCHYKENLSKAKLLMNMVINKKDLHFNEILAQYLKDINYENKETETSELC